MGDRAELFRLLWFVVEERSSGWARGQKEKHEERKEELGTSGKSAWVNTKLKDKP